MQNATGLLIDAADGLRVVNEVEQLAAMEWAACQTSSGDRRRWPWNVHVTPYSFSMPKIRRCTPQQ